MATNNLGRIAIIHQGTYSAAKAYVPLDCVTTADSTYLCIQAGTGKAPASSPLYWSLMTVGAYALAKAGGYAGTEGQFVADVAAAGNYAANASTFAAQTAIATTKASEASASALQLQQGVASPAGTYANLAALISANPAHDKIYVTLDDGKWCYWNGTAFVVGGTYQALAGVDPAIVAKVPDGELFHTNAITAGSTINASGVVTGNAASFYVSALMPVIGGNEYRIANNINASSYYNCFYDADNVLVVAWPSKGDDGLSGPKNIYAPANARWLRISGATASISTQSVSMAFDIQEIIDKQSTDLTGGKELLIKKDITFGKGLIANGVIVINAANYMSDYMPISPANAYYININQNSAYTQHCFYDADKVFISSIDSKGGEGGLGKLKVYPPSNAAYLRITGTISSLPNQFVRAVNIPKEYTDVSLDVDESKARILMCNIFSPALARKGKHLLATGAEALNADTYYVSDYIRVISGYAYEIKHSAGSSSYFNCFFDSTKTLISSFNGLGDLGGAGSKKVIAPAGAYWLRITGTTANMSSQEIFRYASSDYDTQITQIATNVATNVANDVVNATVTEQVEIIVEDIAPAIINGLVAEAVADVVDGIVTSKQYLRTTLKAQDDTNGGLGYCAFSSGIIFDGKEVHATREGANHITLGPETYGKIRFDVRDIYGNFTKTYPDIDFMTQGGELRDPNLSKSRDGATLFLSCFLTGGSSGNKIYALNKSYQVTSSCAVTGDASRVIWGATLQTPDGYLLKTSYGSGMLTLYRSTTIFSGSLAGMLFAVIATLDNVSAGPSECAIGYHKTKLVAIWRTNANSKMSVTSNLEGDSGWSAITDLGHVIHAPVFLPYCKDDYQVFAGGRMDVGRPAVIGLLNTDAKKIMAVKRIDPIANDSYPSLIRLSQDRYSMVHYNEYSQTNTALYHREINIRYILDAEYLL